MTLGEDVSFYHVNESGLGLAIRKELEAFEY